MYKSKILTFSHSMGPKLNGSQCKSSLESDLHETVQVLLIDKSVLLTTSITNNFSHIWFPQDFQQAVFLPLAILEEQGKNVTRQRDFRAKQIVFQK